MLIYKTRVRRSTCVIWKCLVSGYDKRWDNLSKSKNRLTSKNTRRWIEGTQQLCKRSWKGKPQVSAQACHLNARKRRGWVMQRAVHSLPCEPSAFTFPKLFPPAIPASKPLLFRSNCMCIACRLAKTALSLFICKENWLREMTNKMQEFLIGILLGEEH